MAKIVNIGILLLAVITPVLIPYTTEAAEHEISWIIPSTNEVATHYPNYSANTTFRVNDVLVFNFPTNIHNVATLRNKKDFDACNFSSPLRIIKQAPAKITLDQAGEYYFACQISSHCKSGQKLNIIVSASSSSASPAEAPSSPAASVSVTSILSFVLIAISINVLL